jgi:hypothetical protein
MEFILQVSVEVFSVFLEALTLCSFCPWCKALMVFEQHIGQNPRLLLAAAGQD